MCRLRIALAKAVFIAGCVLLAVHSAMAQNVTVFAASSLTEAMNDALKAYAADAGASVRVSYASSATLARQIENGALADIFFSADEVWMDYLQQRALLEPGTRVARLGNRLVLVAPSGTPRRIELRKGFDLATLLGNGRLAIGHPDTVPAGNYARQALTWLGVWEIAAARVARAENVRMALAYVERGEAPLGIVYATDIVLAPGVQQVGEFPAESHAPIRYPMAVVAGRNRPEVRAFHAFLSGSAAATVFRRRGFQVI